LFRTFKFWAYNPITLKGLSRVLKKSRFWDQIILICLMGRIFLYPIKHWQIWVVEKENISNVVVVVEMFSERSRNGALVTHTHTHTHTHMLIFIITDTLSVILSYTHSHSHTHTLIHRQKNHPAILSYTHSHILKYMHTHTHNRLCYNCISLSCIDNKYLKFWSKIQFQM